MKLYKPKFKLYFIVIVIFRNHLITLMALSTTFSSTYPVLSTPPHLQSDSLPIESSQFAEADKAISEMIQAMEHQTNLLGNKREGIDIAGEKSKRAGQKRVRSPSADTEDWSNLPGQAARNGPVQAKAKKNRAFPKAKLLVFPKIAKCGPKAGRKGALRSPPIDTARPRNRIVDDGYDSDTRAE